MRRRDKGFNLKWFVVFILLAVLVWLVWISFFEENVCTDWDCFNAHLESCEETRFVGGREMIFEYDIIGEGDGKCVVNVKLLQGELNNRDSIKLEGLDMDCVLPVGVVMLPESDIGNCHGILKEGLQDLIIKKMHSYLVQNLGKLNLEMADLSKVSG
ncbi:MAG: hypothetical protein KJ592_04135 [Nanoarchaeota archaeon]|nr:hypothetical protein [Nanoarchaeota archaeon]